MEKKLKDLRLLVGYGVGYYSGAKESWCIAFDINDLELLKETVGEFEDGYRPYFMELDGKHSEVEGDTYVLEDIVDIIEAYSDCDYDYVEYALKYELEGTKAYEKLKGAQELVRKLEIKTKYKHKTTKEIIDLVDYDKWIEIVYSGKGVCND